MLFLSTAKQVSPMLLLNIGEDQHILSTNGASVPEQWARTCIHEPFVSHVREHKALCSDKLEAASLSNGQCFLVPPCKDLRELISIIYKHKYN